MRGFMAKYTKVDHHQIKTFPSTLKTKVRNAFVFDLKAWLSIGVPVVIHQKWSKTNSAGHYRIVTGFDDTKKLFYIMDPRPGAITQSYADFYSLWEYDDDWVTFTFLAYHVDRNRRKKIPKKLKVRL